METIIKTAIDFLNEEKKVIDLEVMDYLKEDDFYCFNRTTRGSEYFELKSHSLDWDGFYFEINANINFNYEAWHRTATREEPEEKELEFSNIDATVEITECMKWNDETEDMEYYMLSAEERKAVTEYFEDHIELTD